jgi:hypothetical protein
MMYDKYDIQEVDQFITQSVTALEELHKLTMREEKELEELRSIREKLLED